MYAWQAGGTHPGILSCGNFFLRVIVTEMYDNTGQTIRGKQSKNFRVDRIVQSAHIINFLQGGHIPAEMKFPEFSVCSIHFSLYYLM